MLLVYRLNGGGPISKILNIINKIDGYKKAVDFNFILKLFPNICIVLESSMDETFLYKKTCLGPHY